MDYSKILWRAYETFLLPLGGKKVPTPYRINIPPLEHPARQGKSSPQTLVKQTKEDAKREGFDLKKATAFEIRTFMKRNNLGIDCSGFAYRLLNHLVSEVKGKNLEDFGLPHVGRTNVEKLTSEDFAVPIDELIEIKPGDLIRVGSSKKISHCLLVIEVKPDKVIYAHSNEDTTLYGVHQGQIKITNPYISIEKQDWEEDYLIKDFRPDLGDGMKRLKALQWKG